MVQRRFSLTPPIEASGSTIAYGAITVQATPTKIPTTNLTERKALSIRNFHKTTKAYTGGSGVTSSTGFPLLPYESLPFDISQAVNVYGICETGQTAEIRYIELDQGI
jgi:hypothetical protein